MFDAAFLDRWLPPMDITIAALILSQIRFELQRWTRASGDGKRGQSQGFTAFVLLTDICVTLIALVCLAMIVWFAGWKPAFGLVILGFIFGIFWTVLTSLLYGDNFLVQAVALVVSWPLSIYLVYLIYTQLA